jgi:hypothetical protein
MIRDILVHVKPTESSSPHEAAAVAVAKAHGARLTGLATLRDVSMLKLLFPRENATSASRIEKSYALAAAAERRFRALAEAAEVTCDWQVAEGDAAEVLGVAARYHDLTVVEQTDLVSDEIGFDVPETCVLSSGRPVLVASPTPAGSIRSAGRSSSHGMAVGRQPQPCTEPCRSLTVRSRCWFCREAGAPPTPRSHDGRSSTWASPSPLAVCRYR